MTKINWGEMDIGGPRHYFREGLIVSFVRKVMNSGLILDAGCGGGSLSIRLAKAGFRVEAIDECSRFVEISQEKVNTSGMRDFIHVDKGDVKETRFLDETFDGVVCGEVLEHVEDDLSVIKEFNRGLKMGGVCVITVPANPRYWDLADIWAGHRRRYTKKHIVSLFNKRGFRVEKVDYWGFPIMFLYHKIIFLTWLKKVMNKNIERRKKDLVTKLGMNKYLSAFIASIFRLDCFFSKLPLGIGMILRARKIRNL